jgi:hypothetical protein
MNEPRKARFSFSGLRTAGSDRDAAPAGQK